MSMLFELLARRARDQGDGETAERSSTPDDLLLSTSDKIDVIQALASYNARRVKQMILAINALIILSIINNVIFDRGLWLSLAAGTVFCVLFLARRYYDTDRPSAAQFIFLWTIFGAVTYITWAGDGLRDQIIVGNAVVLVFSAILATPRHFLVMYMAVILNTIALGLANEFGWVDYTHFAFDWSNVGDAVMLYSVTAVTVFILAYDMRQLLARYNKEYRKAKASEDEIFRLANHDTLTGLPNLFMAEKKYRDEISGRHGPKASVLMVGLDNFKTVNDSLGHVFGDSVLKMISTRLADVAGKAFLFRVGGDVFGLMCTEATTPEAVAALADRVQKRVSAPLEAGGHVIMLTCSLGGAIRANGSVTFEHLRREADIAMYRAKSVAPNTFKLFDETMNNQVLASASMAAQLRTAIEKKQFKLFLQPKIDLESGKIRGAEALLRWFPEDGPPIRPDVFIPVAEDTGMIIEIGAWVIQEACRQCKEIQSLGHTDFAIAVNISAIQFKRGTLESIVMDALDSCGLSPESLELELTESLLLEDEYDIKGQISRLAAQGISFSVDDFGKGYSNLGNLGKFDVATLKIDQSFTFAMFDSAQDLALVEAIVRMAKALGLKIVAEGVETQRAASMLSLFGVDSGQGYYWSKPLPESDFVQYLDAYDGGKAKSA
ncbi:MAG: EAL domain-containing protein [Rhizobium sp.]|nr:EAL domain-containing protein [Rhizobium sp.]